MTSDVQQVSAALAERFGKEDFTPAPMVERSGTPGAQPCLRVGPEVLREVMALLKTDERCRFDQVADITCVDYLDFPDATDRYAVTYNLVSTGHNLRLWVKCFVNDPNPRVPSVVSLWPGADWPEREVYDLFGITFDGHPDLRRIMTWEGFVAHPLRKDYPLRGRGEREDFDVVRRDSA